MDWIKDLGKPDYTAKFQQLCGVFYTDDKTSSCGRGDNFNENGNIDRTPKCISKSENNGILNCKEGFRNRNGFKTNNSNSGYPVNTGDNCAEDELGLLGCSSENSTPFKKLTPEKNYVIKHRSLFNFFTAASCMGNEAFYLIFYPFCVWNVDALVIRRTALVWCICMYVGQAAKDYLRWPRPSSPPVVKLETIYLQEFSMPSTHAMSAASIPFMLAYLLTYRYEVSPVLLLCLAVFWCVTVCVSRLYLGVHSVLDLLVGCLLSFIIMAAAIPCLEDFDLYQQTHPLAPVVTFITGLAMCTVFYPTGKEGATVTHGDAVQIVSIMAGVNLGTWLNYQLGYTTQVTQVLPLAFEFPELTKIAISMVRFIIGTISLWLVRLLLKKRCVKFFSYLFGLEKPDMQHPHVMVAYKFVVFYVLGVFIFFFVPIFHYLFGLDRPSFYSEV